MKYIGIIQCTPDISRPCISRNWIYRSGMLDPIFWHPRVRYFLRHRGNSLDQIHGRQFFVKCAHRDSLCSQSQETIFHKINSCLPVNAGWNTCCAMVSHARRSIDTSIVSQIRVQLTQCQWKLRLHIANQIKRRSFNQIVAVSPRCLHPPSCPDTKTVPQQIKSAWLQM